MANQIVNYFDMVPDQDNTLNLGASDLRFKNLYAQTIDIVNVPTISDLTEGLVLFAGTAGVLAQSFNLRWDNNIKQLQIGSTNYDGFENVPLSIGRTINDYFAPVIQNFSDGAGAYTDFSLSADNDGQSLVGHYIDMGIAGSGVSGVSTGNILDVSVNSGGEGYVVDDILTLIDGNQNATVKVLTVDVGGVVLTVEIIKNGTGYTVTNNVPTESVGEGLGCVIDIISLLDVSLDQPGGGYIYTSGGHLCVGTDCAEPIIFHTGGLGVLNERMRINDTSVIIKGANTIGAILDTSSLTTSDKTFTFPNKSGTFAMTSDITGGSLYILDATGSVDDANVTFTFASKPTLIVINGASYRENYGWSWNTLTATLDNAVGTGGDIYGLGGSLSILEATGTIDDSNIDFTFLSKPTCVVVNGSTYRENKGWSWNTLTATLDYPVGTGGNIYGF